MLNSLPHKRRNGDGKYLEKKQKERERDSERRKKQARTDRGTVAQAGHDKAGAFDQRGVFDTQEWIERPRAPIRRRWFWRELLQLLRSWGHSRKPADHSVRRGVADNARAPTGNTIHRATTHCQPEHRNKSGDRASLRRPHAPTPGLHPISGSEAL